MILILRGHIRKSLITSDLYNLIKNIYEFHSDLKIYIHTWNVLSSNISWRNIEENNTTVDNEMILEYFDDLKILIKKIIIDNDNSVELLGNVNGNINNQHVPLLGWKYYCYGKYKIIKYVYKNANRNEMVINTRFDVLNNSNSFSEEQILTFIKNNTGLNYKKNLFLYDNERYGIDNIYIGNITTMYKLIYPFQYELDKILNKYNNVRNPEYLIYRMNNDIFNDNNSLYKKICSCSL
jgi:hypothetical protein